jgi:photosystem II stability/assembly factor-like uncharacterized protein
MPVATGRLKAIAIGKSAPATLLVLGLAASLHSQNAATPSWTDLGAKWEPDFSWGALYSKSPTRMAADAHGNLYVSQGDSLYLGSSDGTGWKAAPIMTDIGNGKHTPVILGPDGKVLWGSWTSGTWGATWRAASGEVATSYYSAAGIAPNGAFLYGASMDVIYRAANLETKPERVHMGNTFGSIVDFAFSGTGTVYAAPEVADLLVSRDGGKTWKERQSLLKSDPSAPESGDLASGLLALEAAYPEESLWMAGDHWGEKAKVIEYVWSGDSLAVRRHANRGAPDSALTGLQVQRLATGGIALWLGTWGQGVYRSLDRGESWHPVNTALLNKYVEALVLGANGRIFALTKFGLFSAAAAPLGISPRAGTAKEGWDRRIFGFAPLPGGAGFGTAEGGIFRADGRRLFQAPPSPGINPAAGAAR